MSRLTTIKDAEDFVRGCTFMATGGGGEPKDGMAKLQEALQERNELVFTPDSKVRDDEWTVCLVLMGTISPKPTPPGMMLKKGFRTLQLEAMNYLEERSGVSIRAVVAPELGGEATSGAVAAAAMAGTMIIDGDYAGRAVPELSQATPCLHGRSMWPIATVDKFGNRIFIEDCSSNEMAERIGKFLSVASFGLVGQAGFLCKGKEMKRALIPGTLSRCLEIGRLIRRAREEKKDAVEEVVKALEGWFLFEGQVSNKKWEDRDGYTWGEHTITGIGRSSGHEFKIWFKNENHMSWLDGQPYVTSPDLLNVVDRKTGEPLTNMGIAKGQKVAIVGLKSPEVYRKQAGIDVFGPRHFGFDVDYRPIEELV